RWVVERTLAWISRCRRLSQDDENIPPASETFIYLAMIPLMLKRLAETFATSKTPSENKGPNPARKLAIRKSPNPLVVLVDDDAVLEENCIAELIKAYQKYPDGAVWSLRIVYYYKQDVIQFEGDCIHYLAEAVLLNGDKPIENGVKDVTRIQIAGGVSYFVSKGASMSIGLFDEDYFFGRRDGEFTFRLNHSGYLFLASNWVDSIIGQKMC
ncbi:MAG: hypothetical protein BRC46_17205, partial [Cyanobacteria bacterium QS_6_48_18]